MNVLILTYGSRGDVQPYIALGKGLQQAGHHVTLATSVRFQSFIEENSLKYAYLNDELLSIIDTDDGKALLDKGSNIYELIKRGIKISTQLKPAQKALLIESWEAAKQCQPDIIVFHAKAGAAPHIAEKMNIPCVLATPTPMLVPTTEWCLPIFPDLKLGQWYNRLTFNIVGFITNKVWKNYANSFRTEIGLPSIKNFNFLKTSQNKAIPIIHAHSEAVLPRPADWPDHAYITGYWFIEERNNIWSPPQSLINFLNAGPPPVYIGFGSMAGRNPKKLTNIVIEALKKTNLRGVICTGWGGLQAASLPENIFKINQAPHSCLLPHMAAIVHHGGAGTTAASLRAGKPSIIVPFFGDQALWGKSVHQLGAGPKPLPQKKLTSSTLASAMHEATTNQMMIKTAKEIGKKIRDEDGIKNAIAVIERLSPAKKP